MILFALIASHANVDLETVAQLSAGSSSVPNEHVILATCNRLEIYGQAESEAAAKLQRENLFTALHHSTGLPRDLIARSFVYASGANVSHHLFSVASGLESAVLGEREIAGQVRRALSSAQETAPVPGGLTALFQQASRTAKRVGSQTALGKQGRSIVSVALDLSADISGADWRQKKVGIIGTGAYAGVTLALLRERGVHQIGVFSGSGRAVDFAAARNAQVYESVEDAVRDSDILVGCSGTGRRLMAEDIAGIRGLDAKANQKPLLLVDLALNHDFDSAAAQLPNVDMVTLESVLMAAPDEQHATTREANEIVDAAAAEFERRQAARRIDSAIVALRTHTMNVLDSELEKVRKQHGCTAASEEVEFALRRMVKQLLHIPTVRARDFAAAGRQDEYEAALEVLYGIEVSIPSVVSELSGTFSDSEAKADKPGASDDGFACPHAEHRSA